MTGIHPYAIVVAGWIVYNKLFIFASGAKQGIRKERKMWSNSKDKLQPTKVS